jgi:hypothetical protein
MADPRGVGYFRPMTDAGRLASLGHDQIDNAVSAPDPHFAL